jgi:hypothetical protein
LGWTDELLPLLIAAGIKEIVLATVVAAREKNLTATGVPLKKVLSHTSLS